MKALQKIVLFAIVGVVLVSATATAKPFCYDEDWCINETPCWNGVCVAFLPPEWVEIIDYLDMSMKNTDEGFKLNIEIQANSSICDEVNDPFYANFCYGLFSQYHFLVKDYVTEEIVYEESGRRPLENGSKTVRFELNYTFNKSGIYKANVYVYTYGRWGEPLMDKETEILFVQMDDWSFHDLKRKYDSDDDGVISLEEVMIAIQDWYSGLLSDDEVKAVIGLWKMGLSGL